MLSPVRSTEQAAAWLFTPTKQISKLSARKRVFHGNKAYEQQRSVADAFSQMQEYVRRHEPKVYAECERKRRARATRRTYK